MELTGGPESMVLTQPTLRNIPEDGKIQVKRSESLRSCKFSVLNSGISGRLLKAPQYCR
jgi:hypothetical protein